MEQIIAGCKEKPEMALLIVLCYLLDSGLEYWLGKTQKVKASSKFELIITTVAMIAAYFLRRKEDVSSEKGN